MKGILSAAFCILVWGWTFVGTHELLTDFSALEILVVRFALAWTALTVIAPRRLVRKSPGDEWLFVGMGLTGATVYQLLENCAIYYTDAVNVAILTSVGPIITALLVRLVCRERIGAKHFWPGALVAMAGVIAVAVDGVVTFHVRPIGDAMILAAMVSWGFYSILIKKVLDKGYPHALVVRRAFLWTILFLLPVSVLGVTESGWLALDGSFSIVLDRAANLARFTEPRNLVCLAFLGLFASAGCFVLWNVACNELGVIKSTICIYLLPLVSIVFSLVAGGEWPSPMSIAGAAAILVGVGLANFNWRILK